MKKYFSILALGLASFAILSCNKELAPDTDPIDGGETVKVPMTFTAATEDSKANISGSSFLWNDGDAIAVFDGTDLNKFTIAPNSEGKQTAPFSGSAAAAATYFSVAPYEAATNLSTANTRISITIPSTQTVQIGRCVASDALVSTAEDSGTGSLSFENQFSVVKVRLTRSDVVSVQLKGNNNESIGGTNHYYYAGEGAPRVDLTNAGQKQVTLVCKDGDDPSAFPAGDYFIAIWPTEFTAGYRLILTLEDGSKTMLNTSESVTYERNGGANLGEIDNKSTWCPSTITKAAQLKMWRRLAEAGAYGEGDEVKLGADINLGGYAWTPVSQFLGIFNGQNHKIYNVVISNSSDNRIGFIRTLGSSGGEAAVLKNVVFGSSNGTSADGTSSISLSIESSGSWSYAGLVGYAHKNSLIQNVTTFIPVTATSALTTKHAIGGFAGAAGDNAVFDNCVNFADVISNSACTTTEDSAIGGILGQTGNVDVQFLSCTNNGNIGNHCIGVSCIGGIIGKSSGTGMLVDQCVNDHSITNYAASVASTKGNWDISIGGIIGVMGNTTTVNKCSNSGQLYCEGATDGDYDVCYGGIVGNTTKNGSIIKGCSNTAEYMHETVTFNSYLAAGGIIGRSSGKITITKADDGTLTTNTAQYFGRHDYKHNLYVGGIAGLIEKQAETVVEFCRNEGRIVGGSGTQSTAKINFNAGGICGGASSGIIRDCVNNGFIIGRDGDFIAWYGGIVGCKDKFPTSLLRCVNNGAISGYNCSGSSSVGGLLSVFQPDQTTVRDCTNSGLITTANVYTNASGNTPGVPVSYQNKDYYKGGLFGYVNAPKSDVTDNVTGCIVNCTLSNQTVGKDGYTGIIAGQTKSTASTAYKVVFGTVSAPVMIVNTSNFEYGTASNPATITPGDVMNTDANVKKWLMGSTSSLYDATNGSSNTNIVDFNYVIATPAVSGIE